MSDRPANAFLRSLGASGWAALAPHVARVDLTHGAVPYQPDDRVEWVYFPQTALLSVLTTTADAQSVETAMCGNEGAGGVLEACGSGVSATPSLVPVDGAAWRAPAFARRRA